MANDLLSVSIIAKEKIVFHEDVRTITSYNERGTFDILAEHTNFITVIKDKIIIHKADGTDREIVVDNGVLRVASNKVDIFIGLLSVNDVVIAPI
jgi:F0F1-type ATP synthase epsilon subunit